MDKHLKQIKPMLCPVCGKFYFSKLSDTDIEQLGMTPNTTQCTRCGWYYDLEQLKDPDLENQSNKMSLNQYKNWYQAKISQDKKWQYYLDFIGKQEPHKCPVCGWEDTGFEKEPDEKPSPYMMSFNETKAWFKKQREKNPKFRKFPK